LDDPTIDTTQSTAAATKNQKKKANKRKNKAIKNIVNEWQQRHMSPAFSKIMALESQADI